MSPPSTPYIEAQIARIASRLLIGGSVVLVVVVVLMGWHWRYWLDYFLEEGKADFNGTCWLMFALLLAGAAGYRLRNALVWRADPTRHAIWQRLRRYGDPAELARRISDEALTAKRIEQSPMVSITASGFLLGEKDEELIVLRLDDLVWAFKEVTQHQTYTVNTGQSFKVKLIDRYRGTHELQLSSMSTDGLLVELEARAPWALFGWSAELQLVWDTQPKSILEQVAAARTRAHDDRA